MRAIAVNRINILVLIHIYVNILPRKYRKIHIFPLFFSTFLRYMIINYTNLCTFLRNVFLPLIDINHRQMQQFRIAVDIRSDEEIIDYRLYIGLSFE